MDTVPFDHILPFDLTKKKKKKGGVVHPCPEDPVGQSDEKTESVSDHIEGDKDAEGPVLQKRFPWEGTDRDYKCEELLGRFYSNLRENNPLHELHGLLYNFLCASDKFGMLSCVRMHRKPDHVMSLLAELGTTGSLDGQQRLVVKGRFVSKSFEGILRRYIKEYVTCNGCKSLDTTFTKENRLTFLRCEKYGSGRSVAPIDAGFVAHVGSRKAET